MTLNDLLDVIDLISDVCVVCDDLKISGSCKAVQKLLSNEVKKRKATKMQPRENCLWVWTM